MKTLLITCTNCWDSYPFVANGEGHARGLQPKQLADSMGHDLETHMNSYARFMSKDLESAFDAANKKVKAA